MLTTTPRNAPSIAPLAVKQSTQRTQRTQRTQLTRRIQDSGEIVAVLDTPTPSKTTESIPTRTDWR